MDRSDTLDVDSISERTSACEQFIADCMAGKFEPSEVPEKLKAIGIGADAAEDYVKQLSQRLAEKHRGEQRGPDEEIPEAPTPEGLNENDQADYRRRKEELVAEARRRKELELQSSSAEAATWASIYTKLKALHSPSNTR